VEVETMLMRTDPFRELDRLTQPVRMIGSDGHAALLARIAVELARQPDVQATIQRLTELARDLTGCDLAAVWRLTPTGTELQGATDRDTAERLARILNDVPTARDWASLRHDGTLRVDDLLDDQRWPDLADAVRADGLTFRSALAYQLGLTGQPLGALLLYADKPRFFTDDIARTASLFASHATIALHAAKATERADNLQIALRTNRRIAMAIGVLMSRYKVTDTAAFDMLRTASQHSHRKLHDIAEDVTATGELPINNACSPADQATTTQAS
jgi:transcriptional regulator with GAF, ATPase, and Fis domain